jgi:hypothetical protein
MYTLQHSTNKKSEHVLEQLFIQEMSEEEFSCKPHHVCNATAFIAEYITRSRLTEGVKLYFSMFSTCQVTISRNLKSCITVNAVVYVCVCVRAHARASFRKFIDDNEGFTAGKLWQQLLSNQAPSFLLSFLVHHLST